MTTTSLTTKAGIGFVSPTNYSYKGPCGSEIVSYSAGFVVFSFYFFLIPFQKQRVCNYRNYEDLLDVQLAS